MTKREWWELVQTNWQEILAICEAYLPMGDKCDADGEPTKETVRQHILNAYEQKNSILARFLSEAWWRVPEAKGPSIPGWDNLNDIVTEEPDW